jgi:hypothetical protein
MARFRVGPVRFGGGRGASFSFGAGPLGATVGGRRKRSGGSSNGSYESFSSYVDNSDARPLTPAERAAYEYSDIRIKTWGAAAFVMLMLSLFLMTVATIVTPIVFSLMALASLALSVKLYKDFQFSKKATGSSSPTNAQLKAWSRVDQGFVLENLPLIGRFVRAGDREAEEVRRLQALENNPSLRQLRKRLVTRITFSGLVVANFVYCFLFMFPIAGVFSITENGIVSCTENPNKKRTVEGLLCTDAEMYRNYLYIPLSLTYAAIFIAFLLALRTGSFLKVFGWGKKSLETLANGPLKEVAKQYGSKAEAYLPTALKSVDERAVIRQRKLEEENRKIEELKQKFAQANGPSTEVVEQSGSEIEAKLPTALKAMKDRAAVRQRELDEKS